MTTKITFCKQIEEGNVSLSHSDDIKTDIGNQLVYIPYQHNILPCYKDT